MATRDQTPTTPSPSTAHHRGALSPPQSQIRPKPHWLGLEQVTITECVQHIYFQPNKPTPYPGWGRPPGAQSSYSRDDFDAAAAKRLKAAWEQYLKEERAQAAREEMREKLEREQAARDAPAAAHAAAEAAAEAAEVLRRERNAQHQPDDIGTLMFTTLSCVATVLAMAPEPEVFWLGCALWCVLWFLRWAGC